MQAVGLVHGTGFHGEGRSLDSAAAAVLDLKVPKDLQVSDWSAAELTPGQVAYAGVDAIIAWLLWRGLEPRLKQQRRTHSGRVWRHWDAYELQRRAIPAVADMELRGLGFGREEHARQCDGWKRQLAEARHTFAETWGETPPRSRTEKQAWLTQVLQDHPEHFPEWPRTKTGLLSTRAGRLKRLIAIDTVRAMLQITACEQLLNNFGPRLAEQISPVTGRLHGKYNLAASKSGRFSSSSPNMQQLPRRKAAEFPRCIVARDGYVLIGCDWSQVELRGAAWLYGDAALTRLFADGQDIHQRTASLIAGVSPAAVTAGQRDAAKPVNYGAIYGQGAQGLRESAFVNYGVEMSLAEAAHAIDRFFATFHRLHQGLWDNYRICKSRGYVLIGAGRIVKAEWERDVDGRLLFTRCCNLPVQGICADALLRALIWTHGRLKAARIRGGLVLTAHDELLLEVDADDAEKARLLLETTMLDAFSETFPDAPTTGVATAKIGHSWAEAKG
jgi:DNA polymerase-1